MGGIVTDLIEAKRLQPGDDLVSALIAARDDGDRLSPDELTSMLFYLLFVWYEISVDLLANGLLTLLRHPNPPPPCEPSRTGFPARSRNC
jgi:cytochrome P450